MKKIHQFFIFIIGIGLCNGSYSQPPQKIILRNLNKTLTMLKAKTHIPILFPHFIPPDPKHAIYYAHGAQSHDGSHYEITIDYTPHCRGAKYCNVGRITGDLHLESSVFFSIGEKNLNEPIKLKHGIVALYTPSHTAADFWPAHIEWRVKETLYQITWKSKMPNEKEMMKRLANSMH